MFAFLIVLGCGEKSHRSGTLRHSLTVPALGDLKQDIRYCVIKAVLIFFDSL